MRGYAVDATSVNGGGTRGQKHAPSRSHQKAACRARAHARRGRCSRWHAGRALHHCAAAVTTPDFSPKDDALQLLRAASLQRFRVLLTSSAPPPS